MSHEKINSIEPKEKIKSGETKEKFIEDGVKWIGQTLKRELESFYEGEIDASEVKERIAARLDTLLKNKKTE